jgi:hypothetical protein
VKSRTLASVSAVCLVLAGATPVDAQTMSLDLMVGSAYNVPTPLTVRQNGYPDIRMTARYDTKPFGPFAPYYSWRLNVWNGDRAWEVQPCTIACFSQHDAGDSD